MFNYQNGIPDPTQRNQTENTKNIIGQKGSHQNDFMFNYQNGIPDSTQRNQTENTKNIIGQKGNKTAMVAFNYDDKPDLTMRNFTSETKNIANQASQYTHKEYMFNYDNSIPDLTQRSMSDQTKNIIGQKGDSIQNRSRLDYSNALLNTVKENVAKGRMPTVVKDNKGPTCAFTDYTFNDDRPQTQRPLYSSTKTIGNISNPLYTFSENNL